MRANHALFAISRIGDARQRRTLPRTARPPAPRTSLDAALPAMTRFHRRAVTDSRSTHIPVAHHAHPLDDGAERALGIASQPASLDARRMAAAARLGDRTRTMLMRERQAQRIGLGCRRSSSSSIQKATSSNGIERYPGRRRGANICAGIDDLDGQCTTRYIYANYGHGFSIRVRTLLSVGYRAWPPLRLLSLRGTDARVAGAPGRVLRALVITKAPTTPACS